MVIIAVLYALIVWLVFFRLKWLRWGWLTGAITVLVGLMVCTIFVGFLSYLAPTGRVMVIGAIPRGGFGAIFTRPQSGPPFDPTPSLEADGFRFVRVLGEREGMRFVEGLKA